MSSPFPIPPSSLLATWIVSLKMVLEISTCKLAASSSSPPPHVVMYLSIFVHSPPRAHSWLAALWNYPLILGGCRVGPLTVFVSTMVCANTLLFFVVVITFFSFPRSQCVFFFFIVRVCCVCHLA